MLVHSIFVWDELQQKTSADSPDHMHILPTSEVHRQVERLIHRSPKPGHRKEEETDHEVVRACKSLQSVPCYTIL
jgi:hypothetical protein